MAKRADWIADGRITNKGKCDSIQMILSENDLIE